MAVPPLRSLHEAGHDVVLVVSGRDKRRGSGKETSPSPVKAAAIELGIPVTAEPDDVLTVDADLGVVVAYGRIIRPHLLAHLPMVNIHFSLLPRWRGAAPVERAILAGDERTGVCLMAVEEGLDTGGVYARGEVPIGPRRRPRMSFARSSWPPARTCWSTDLGSRAGHARTAVLRRRHLCPQARAPSDLELHWDRPAVELHRIVRVGGAWTTFRGRRLKVLGPVGRGPGDDRRRVAGPGTLGGEWSARDGGRARESWWSTGEGAGLRLRTRATGRQIGDDGRARGATARQIATPTNDSAR